MSPSSHTQPRSVEVNHAGLWSLRRRFESSRGYFSLHALARRPRQDLREFRNGHPVRHSPFIALSGSKLRAGSIISEGRPSKRIEPCCESERHETLTRGWCPKRERFREDGG